MAHWGIAIARWTQPFAATIRPPQQLQAGLEAITKARAAGAKTERERAYIEAAAKLYTGRRHDPTSGLASLAYEKRDGGARGESIRRTGRRRSSGRCR